MRVHGDIKIKRRAHAESISPKDAKPMLREDFQELCGYCGKNGRRIRERFHVDHFVPQSLAEERKSDYSNFVWACPRCNLIKSDHWPSEDVQTPHTEEIGFIDPATEEYDAHLFRDEAGYIRGCTPLGEQICSLLKFDVRRTDWFWKIEELCRIKDELEQAFHRSELTDDEARYYVSIQICLDKLLDAMYDEKE